MSLTKKLYDHYKSGVGGKFKLTKNDFKRIIKTAKSNGLLKGTEKLTGDALVNFYDGDELGDKLSFGRATVRFKNGNPIGFRDTYDFDPRPWGVRPYTMESLTRMGNTPKGASFQIIYDE